jgi:ArsR family transcriptional regulator, arsenate/arsenite/antimonite-responsive transcriptional repressor
MTKVELFDKDLQVAASYFKVLGHPARLSILKYLADTKVCISGDISDELPLSRTTVNQHLQELKDLGLIKGHIDGVKMNYCLNPEGIDELKMVIGEVLGELNCCKNLNCE